MIRTFVLLLLLAIPAHASEKVVSGLSQSRVAITANFDGSEILIFGAVKRDAPVPETGKMDVIISVEGPSTPVMVRRKSKHFGIWVNSEAVEVDAAPSFYAVAASDNFASVLNNTEDQRHSISINRAIRSVGAPMDVSDSQSFTAALIRIRTENGLYQMSPQKIEFDQETLFRTSIALPSNLTEGAYAVRMFLVRNGRVVDHHETSIVVQKVGLERYLFNLANEKPLIYGLLSLVIAISAGWSASTVFRYIRG